MQTYLLKNKNDNMPRLVSACVFLSLITITSLTFSVYNFYEITKLQQAVTELREELYIVKDAANPIHLRENYDEYEDEDFLNDDEENLLMDDLSDNYVLNSYDEENDSTEEEFNEDASDLTKDLKIKRNRNKRDVLAETIDGIQINSESYADVKKQTESGLKLYGLDSSPITQPGFHSPAWLANQNKQTAELKHYGEILTKPTTAAPHPIYSRKSRVMHVDDKSKAFKQVIKRPAVKALERKPFEDQQEMPVSTSHKGGRHRPKHWQRLETMDESQVTILKPNRKQMFAAHFNGDTSKYVLGQHTNFEGNGHLRHMDQTYVDWRARDWMHQLNMDQYFRLENGVMTIKESGLYFVYSQIYYLDQHDTNGYRVYKNEMAILQCTTMTHSTTSIIKGNTCYTAGVEYIAEGDKISIRDLADERYSLFEQGKSFFGVIRLADARMK